MNFSASLIIQQRNYESMRNPQISTSGHANPPFSWDSSHFLVDTFALSRRSVFSLACLISAIFRTLGIDAVLCCSMMIDYALTTPKGGDAFGMEKLGCLTVSLSRSGKSVGIFSNFVVDDFVFWPLDDDLFSLTTLPTPEGGGAFEMPSCEIREMKKNVEARETVSVARKP
ncbi:hypothetical protein Cgig2_003537 [Carnegiea gigantea]|uniref:Uncharacterized protein n=1 Tax=Carnegiea gigantea TaxID=171969 RepID=A0A9Q1JU21_9CARY|nr:hypothetical protein Cgig2_003537 [Carnegiea gigantea]